jgi:hypothetical protein
MATALIAVVAIATYVSPFALIYVWVIRLWDVDGRKDRRALWAWVSLALVSLAVTVYWLSAFGEPPVATPEWDVYIRRWSRISIAATMLAFTTGFLGGGREKFIVWATSLIVPLSWALTRVLE